MNTREKISWIVLAVIFVCSFNACAVDPYSGLDTLGIETIVAEISNPTETWRIDANTRIEQNRKANMDITVVDQATGLPVPDAEIDVKLTRHGFRFGGVVKAKALLGADSAVSEQLYKDTFLNMGFTAAGFNNALKQKQRAGQEPYIQPSLDWFASHQIPVRGHCLIWPGINSNGSNHLTPAVAAAMETYNADPTSQNRDALRTLIEDEMIEWSSLWDVYEWDVINEERGNHEIMDIFGDSVMVDWFNIAQLYSVNPNVKLLLNEFQLVSDMSSDTNIVTSKITTYKNTVNFLLANGAPITGLGFQSRFGTMPSGGVIYQRLQQFNSYNLPISATEFEMKDTIVGELNKAVMTERVMTAYFSHHLVSGIYAWSLFPNEDKEIVDIYGFPNLRGKAWLYLTKNVWMTDEMLVSDQHGDASVRGFKGDYDVTIRSGASEKTVQVTLDQDSSFTIEMSGSTSFGPTDDAHVHRKKTSNNYGNTADLELRSFDTNFTRVSYLKFNVSGLSEPPSDAILKLYSNTQNGQVDAVAVADTNWSEGSINWNNRPTTGSLIGSATAASGGWFEIDVSDYITGDGTYSIALETPVNVLGELSSSEGANPPVLEVSAPLDVSYAPSFITDPVVGANATEDAAYSSTIANDASVPDSSTMTFSKISGPVWLTVASDGTLSGTPTNSNVGVNAFTVRVDTTGGYHTATLNITVVNTNDVPAFTSDPINEKYAIQGSPYSSSIADDATDPDSDPLTFSRISGPAWLSVAADGTLGGTPGAADLNLNSFTVRVSDGKGGSQQAAMLINVTPTPTVFPIEPTDDAHTKQSDPTANFGSTADLELWSSGTNNTQVVYLKFEVSGFFEPISSAILKLYSNTQNGGVDAFAVADTSWTEDSITWDSRPAAGSLIAGAIADSGSWFQIDVSSYITSNGTYSIALETPINTLGEISSKEGANKPTLEISAPADINEDPAFIVDPIVEVNATEDAAYSSTITDHAFDPESDPMTYSKTAGPAWLTVAANGTLSGTPGNSNVGANVFVVQVDAAGGSDTATLNITVINTNDAPTFITDPINKPNAAEDAAYSGTLAGLTADADGDAMSFLKIAGPAWLTIGGAGSLSGTPTDSNIGENTFTVQVSDGNGGIDTATLTITVDSVNWCDAANLDGIGPVNLADFAILAANWLQIGSGLAGDIKQDESVNEIDLDIMAIYWLSDCN
jgi:hypothetical protein